MSEIRRKLLNITNSSDNLFDSAYLFCPYSQTRSATDINNNISPNYNNSNFTSNGIYYSGSSNQYTNYNDSKLYDYTKYDNTVFIELIPENIGRNSYILDIFRTSNGHNYSLFIYYAKHNKFGLTITYPGGGHHLIDDEISSSSPVVYGQLYKVCMKWENTKLSIFINGSVYIYNFTRDTRLPDYFMLAKNTFRTDRNMKGTIKTLAFWNKALTDNDCIKLTT